MRTKTMKQNIYRRAFIIIIDSKAYLTLNYIGMYLVPYIKNSVFLINWGSLSSLKRSACGKLIYVQNNLSFYKRILSALAIFQ